MARKTTTTTGTIVSVEHAATSRMGNPTYRIKLEDGREFLTETDGQIGYAAQNYAPRRHLDGEPTPATLHLGARGRVWNITREGE